MTVFLSNLMAHRGLLSVCLREQQMLMQKQVIRYVGNVLVLSIFSISSFANEVSRISVSARVVEKLKEEYKYSPPILSETLVEPGPEVVVMDKITVQTSLLRRDLNNEIEKQIVSSAARRPKLLSRGAALEKKLDNYRFETSTFKTSNGIKLFSTSW